MQPLTVDTPQRSTTLLLTPEPTEHEGLHSAVQASIALSGNDENAHQLEAPRFITDRCVMDNGKLYMVTSKGILSCLDILTGEQVWRKRLEGSGYHVSLLVGDGKIYIPNARGLTTVLTEGEEPQVLGENRLDEGGYASPALVGGSILIRSKSKLLRINKETS